MKVITEDEFVRKVEPELKQVFLNREPHSPMFGDNVESVRVLYEYRPPDRSIVDAIIQAASAIGDTGLYISVLNRPISGRSTSPEHWWVPFDEVSTYLSGNTEVFHFAYQLENVIYSPTGQWGLMYSFENYGIVAGNQAFMDKFSCRFPRIDQQILAYLSYVKECIDVHGKEKVNVGWLSPFLSKIYGSEDAEAMLKEADLDDYISMNSI